MAHTLLIIEQYLPPGRWRPINDAQRAGIRFEVLNVCHGAETIAEAAAYAERVVMAWGRSSKRGFVALAEQIDPIMDRLHDTADVWCMGLTWEGHPAPLLTAYAPSRLVMLQARGGAHWHLPQRVSVRPIAKRRFVR